MAPFLSIITSAYNCAASVSSTADSISKLDPRKVQWVVADGASSDGTVEQLKRYLGLNLTIISEKDNGIYDAWNKACSKIKGKWVLFLGMGDRLHPSFGLDQLECFIAKLSKDIKLVWGNVEVVRNEKFRYLSRKPSLRGWEFGRPMLPHHQGVFQSSELLLVNTPFDSSYKIAGDSKFLLSVMKKWSFSHFDRTVSIFEDNGISNNFTKNDEAQNEIERLCRELDIIVPARAKHLARLNRKFNTLANNLIPSSLQNILRPIRDGLLRRA